MNGAVHDFSGVIAGLHEAGALAAVAADPLALTLLKREGCEVVTATDGFEALAKIADQQPQIIFVDIMMPRLDGYQTCALIKGNQLFKCVSRS